jgi:uncharacterized protein YsxB (DUF464 family)
MISRLLVSGHAPLGSHSLLCNSVSCLTQTLIQSCISLLGGGIRQESSSGKALLEIDLSELDEIEMLRLDTLGKSYLLGLQGISKQEPDHLDICLMDGDKSKEM